MYLLAVTNNLNFYLLIDHDYTELYTIFLILLNTLKCIIIFYNLYCTLGYNIFNVNSFCVVFVEIFKFVKTI